MRFSKIFKYSHCNVLNRLLVIIALMLFASPLAIHAQNIETNHHKNKKHHLSKTSIAPSSIKTSPSAATLQQGLQQILNSKSPVHFGVFVRRTDTNQVLFSKEANYLFSPASVMKVLTAVAALDFLGPDFHYQTQILTNGNVTQNVLNGDLYVKFSGDPWLSSSQISHLIEKLKGLGISQVTGHIYIDVSAYSSVPYPPGCIWDDLNYSYAAPITSVIINHNRFALRILPGPISQPPVLLPLLPQGVAHFENHAVTTTQSNCSLNVYSTGDNNFRVEGCVNRNAGSQIRSLALRDPDVYGRWLVQGLLQAHGIGFKSPAQFGTAPAHATILVEYDSPPLTQLVKRLLKKSDNMITNSLFKKLGEKYFHGQGSWTSGLQALKNILRGSGVDFSKYVIADGAGLSRYNLISPELLVKVLDFAYRKPELRNILWVSLPISGIDGTLRGRMGDSAGRVHAKTGTMAGISCLAGYVNNAQYGPFTFAMMVNGFIGKAGPYRALQDRMCEFLIHYRGPL